MRTIGGSDLAELASGDGAERDEDGQDQQLLHGREG
jgi:hypothetical protein